MFDFKGEILAGAVEKTFENRNTPMTLIPAVFDPSFGNDEDKKVQWQEFIKKTGLTIAPEFFENVIAAVKVFLEHLIVSLSER